MVMGQAFAKPGADKVAEMERTLADLCESMYLVFENDWEHTQGAITQEGEAYFGRRGTFLNPKVADEYNNWGNRGGLLATYRRAVELLRANGIDPEHLTA
jgi:hypothetical protein